MSVTENVSKQAAEKKSGNVHLHKGSTDYVLSMSYMIEQICHVNLLTFSLQVYFRKKIKLNSLQPLTVI